MRKRLIFLASEYYLGLLFNLEHFFTTLFAVHLHPFTFTASLTCAAFPEFVGVGSAAAASIDDMDLWSMDDDTTAPFSSPRGSFSSMSSTPLESDLTPQQRWKKALRKINIVRAFGGRPGEANASIALPPDVERKRLVARQELLTTEREYYNRVSGLVDGFMLPLLQFMDAEALAQKDGGGMLTHQNSGGSGAASAVTINPETCAMARRVFGNLEQIRNLTKTLLDDLTDVIATPDGKIGPVFCKIAPYLRIYLAYYHNFDASRLALDQLRQAPWAHGFISACEAQPACKVVGKLNLHYCDSERRKEIRFFFGILTTYSCSTSKNAIHAALTIA